MEIRMKNMVKEGQFMPAYYGETANSCALDKCLARVKEMSGWDEKYPRKVMPDGKIRSVGVALAMQGSCISNVDVGSATIKLGEDGVYNMSIAAADMGTGCDTILHRWQQNVWTVIWMILQYPEQIPILRRMIQALMHQVRLM